MIDIKLDFPHAYEVGEPPDIPGTGTFDIPLLYFPRPKTRPEHDGLWLKIQPANRNAWVGVFAFGYTSPPAISRVVSTFDPERLCVVSNGAAYIVKANEPDTWEQVQMTPVLDVRYIPDHQLLLFADFTGLIAFNSQGIAWRTPRLCRDDLKIASLSSETIEGTGYDPTDSAANRSRFAVDAKTGQSLFPAHASIGGKALW